MAEIKDEVLNTQDVVEVEAEVTDSVSTNNSNPKKPGVGARIKEYFRKQIVTLKRKPQRIAFFLYVVASMFFLISLFTLSKASSAVATKAKGNGLIIFVDTLLSILVLVSFLNTFPNRKKVVIPMLVLVFVMSAVIIACDIWVFTLIQNAINSSRKPYSEIAVSNCRSLLIVHAVLMGVSVLVLALTPVIRKLLNKINTSVVIEDNNLNKGEELVINE